VEDVKNAVVSGEEPRRVGAKSAGRGSVMKFSNGDVSLNDAVKRNGGHIVLSNMNLLFDTSF